MIVTDGLENASRTYTREQVFERIRHQADVYGWEFVYLGAKQELYRPLARNVKMRRSGSKADMRWEVEDRKIQRDQGGGGGCGWG